MVARKPPKKSPASGHLVGGSYSDLMQLPFGEFLQFIEGIHPTFHMAPPADWPEIEPLDDAILHERQAQDAATIKTWADKMRKTYGDIDAKIALPIVIESLEELRNDLVSLEGQLRVTEILELLEKEKPATELSKATQQPVGGETQRQ